jgi:imidazole glycerol-phosphate synthase subunit HisH
VIALVDYGIGNLRSVQKALLAVGAAVSLTSDPEEIRRADKVILPGVGAFGDGMLGLKGGGFVDVLREAWLKEIPLLGICLGMQLLFDSSEEAPDQPGLGYLAGRVRRFPVIGGLKVPHTGWNQLHPVVATGLLDQLDDGCYAYFNHAYYCELQEAGDTLAVTDHGLRFASVVGRGRLFGVQFHPEKSQAVGLQILRNFVGMV